MRINFIIASKKALAYPAKEAAIGYYVQLLVRSYCYINSNPDVCVNQVYVA